MILSRKDTKNDGLNMSVSFSIFVFVLPNSDKTKNVRRFSGILLLSKI